MSRFFGRVSYDGVSEFSIYTLPHFAALLICASLLLLLYLHAERLREKPYEHIVRYTLAVLMLLSNVTIYYYVYSQNLAWYEYLPEATCGLAIYFGAFSLMTKNRKITILTFFWGWGAISTFLAPNLMEGPTRYNFYQFFLRHTLILGSSIYMFKVHSIRVFKKDFKLYIVYTLPAAIIGGIISYIVNKPYELNMFYMLQPAKNTPVFDVIHEWNYPMYVILWLLFAIGIGYIYGLPFYHKERVRTND